MVSTTPLSASSWSNRKARLSIRCKNSSVTTTLSHDARLYLRGLRDLTIFHLIIYTYMDVRANGCQVRPKKIMPSLVPRRRLRED
jgi:hypothetical protein